MWIQTGVTVRKRLSWVVTSGTLTFDLWPWPFAWTLRSSLVITPENFMTIRWWEHSQKGVTDRRTENTICRAAWSQLKIKHCPDFELTTRHTYLTLTGELWSVCCDLHGDNCLWDISRVHCNMAHNTVMCHYSRVQHNTIWNTAMSLWWHQVAIMGSQITGQSSGGTFYLFHDEGYVFIVVRCSVCLSVCLPVSNITEKRLNGFSLNLQGRWDLIQGAIGNIFRIFHVTPWTQHFLAATKQLYKWYFPSVCPSVHLSVCPSVRHTFLTMFPSSYHHEIFRSYYQWPT